MHMIEMLKKRREDGEEGFTLIELMVVVLIIAILIAIAIPTFLGAQDRARDRAAQSNLRNAITAAKTVATDFEGLFVKDSAGALIDESAMTTAEPSLTFTDGLMTTVGPIDVVTGTAGANITMYNKSGSGTFFCISATSAGKVTYGKGTAGTAVDTAGECILPKF